MTTDCTLWFGDCLRVLTDARAVEPQSVDLIYLDPPFNSKRDYNIVHESGTQETMFGDTWAWGDEQEVGLDYIQKQDVATSKLLDNLLDFTDGMKPLQAYLAFMAPRLLACREVLKPTGSIYLHCDPTAGHYLKLVMDAVFGPMKFRNEIAWCYSWPRNVVNQYARTHDTLLFYTKGVSWTFNPDEVRQPYSDSSVGRDEYSANASQFGDEVVLNERGKLPQDWVEIPPIRPNARERLGYPTQKPLALLDHIVKASSNPNDLVLDPFCGCGTAAVASANLGRRFIGVDVAPKTVELMRWRVQEFCGFDPIVHGLPYDFESAKALARPDRSDLHRASRDFERWAVERIPGAQSNVRQTGDRGLDGTARVDVDGVSARNRPVFGFQVKGGVNVGRPDADAFSGALEATGCEAGLLIVVEKSRADQIRSAIGRQPIVRLGEWSGPRIGIWSIESHFEGAEPNVPQFVGRTETQALLAARSWQRQLGK